MGVTNAGHDDLVGTMLRPGLRLDAVIGRGSFGVVFRGRQLAVDRNVAVKVLHAELDPDSEAGLLFRDEIRAIGTLDHRNVVRIYDADSTVDGQLYFVMELLEGRTLQHLADDERISPVRATALVGQLLEGLAAVHAAGRIHADVKPSNALVVSQGNQERVVLVDFGLSRLRGVDAATEAVGGTSAYMAPEQLRAWELEARSDVYSAALVLVRLITGWQRSSLDTITPPLDAITDPALRLALERALAPAPADRPSAADFARALRGGLADDPSPPGPPPPFRELAPMTERDRGRLRGRDADIVRLARRVDPRRPVVCTAPSGTGKTSLLRAGLVPYFDAAGIATAYVACEQHSARSLGEAIALRQPEPGRRLVVILDQIEAVLVGDGEGARVLDRLLSTHRSPDSEIAVVIGVREDLVARLIAASAALSEGAPQVRLGPLDREGARAAIAEPLAEHGVTMEPALMDELLDDLTRASAALGADEGWSSTSSVYPPHLQLAGSALFDALGSHERVITVEHYRGLGGFEAIVGDHLERRLGELTEGDRAVARDVLLSLVSSNQTRAVRGEAELLDAVGARHGNDAVRAVLARLEAQRLLARSSGADGTPTWRLLHDTLAARIEAWLTVQDLDRRRAAEVVRFHLRQSRFDVPAVLSARQLRFLARFPQLIDELELEWARRPNVVWTPRRLVARSRQLLRYRRAVVGGAALAVLAITSLLAIRWLDERARRQREESLRNRDLGLFELELAPFDLAWSNEANAVEAVPIDAATLPELAWTLREPAVDDPDRAGEPVLGARFTHGTRLERAGALVESGVEARGGDAFLVVTGRSPDGDTCPPSTIPLKRLPGYTQRHGPPRRIRVAIPTCQATRFDTIEVAAGPFVFGGLGEPPARYDAAELPTEQIVQLDRYFIDRTEVTNAAFALFADMHGVHDIWTSAYPDALAVARGATYPRADIDWMDARAYCRFLGKDLPTSAQWQKAMRGGLELDGVANPHLRRNLPWGAPQTPPPTAIALHGPATGNVAAGQPGDPRRPSAVGTHPLDASPYGVLDMAGNVQEWTSDVEPDTDSVPMMRRSRISRGGNWFDTPPDVLVEYLTIQNPRSPRLRTYYQGVRCALAL